MYRGNNARAPTHWCIPTLGGYFTPTPNMTAAPPDLAQTGKSGDHHIGVTTHTPTAYTGGNSYPNTNSSNFPNTNSSTQHADRRPREAKTRRRVWWRLHGAPCRGGTWLRQGRCAGRGQGMWGGSGIERGGGSASRGQPLAIVCCGSVYCIYAFGVLGRRHCVSGGSPVARQGSVWLFYKGACISFCR